MSLISNRRSNNVINSESLLDYIELFLNLGVTILIILIKNVILKQWLGLFLFTQRWAENNPVFFREQVWYDIDSMTRAAGS